jgi:hypothetical protein
VERPQDLAFEAKGLVIGLKNNIILVKNFLKLKNLEFFRAKTLNLPRN